jgi:2-polyprenyl-6-methoxyphenol hydroxylase-like FAD-dependent oxidoreductase
VPENVEHIGGFGMKGYATIAGAGVGGLCTAIGLARGGWTVTVLERWPEVVGTGAGLGVWPDAQAALDDLGVGEAFSKRADLSDLARRITSTAVPWPSFVEIP